MDVTIIARQSDAFMLAEVWTHEAVPLRRELASFKDQGLKLLRKLSNQAREGDYKSIGTRDGNSFKGVVDSRFKSFSYTVGEGLMFMVLMDRKFPHQLVFAYLADLRRWFVDELAREFNYNDITSAIESIRIPYKYIKLDRQILKQQAPYKDVQQTNKNLRRIQLGLADVSDIMRKNIDELILRGENLEEINSKAEDLKIHSKKFADTARNMSKWLTFQKYAPLVAGIGVLALGGLWFFGII